MNEVIAWAIIVFSVASCTVAEKYIQADARKTMTPQQICVERAWTQADRMECLKPREPQK